jgi:hypothetical protein
VVPKPPSSPRTAPGWGYAVSNESPTLGRRRLVRFLSAIRSGKREEEVGLG